MAFIIATTDDCRPTYKDLHPPHVELAQPLQFYSIRAWLLCFGWYQHWWAMRTILRRPEYQVWQEWKWNQALGIHRGIHLDCSKHRKVICEICSTLYVLNYFVLYNFLLFLDMQIVQVVEALLLLEAVYPTWTPWLLMTWWHIGNQNISRNYIDRVIQLANDAITTSLWRQNDVATSFRRHNDVIIASCVRWHALQTDIVKSGRDMFADIYKVCFFSWCCSIVVFCWK